MIRLFMMTMICLSLLCGCVNPKADTRLIGSTQSNKYHKQTCQWAHNIKPVNRIYLADADDATDKGYEPCKTCIGY